MGLTSLCGVHRSRTAIPLRTTIVEDLLVLKCSVVIKENVVEEGELKFRGNDLEFYGTKGPRWPYCTS